MAATLPGGNAAPTCQEAWDETATPESPKQGAENMSSRNPLGGQSPKPLGEGEYKVFSTQIAYAHGQILGDVTLVKAGRQWRVSLSTTHPALEKAFTQAFLPLSIDYKIRRYPVQGGATPYKWILWATIKPEIAEPLAIKSRQAIQLYADNKQLLAALTAGLIDTDGTIILHIARRKRLKYKPRFEPEVAIINTDKALLEELRKAWLKYGIKLNIRIDKRPEKSKLKERKQQRTSWRLNTAAFPTMQQLLQIILPYMKHWEKIAKTKLTLAYIQGKIPQNPQLIQQIRDKLEQTIKQQVQEYIKQAQQAYQNKKTYIITPNKIIEKEVKHPTRKETPSNPSPFLNLNYKHVNYMNPKLSLHTYSYDNPPILQLLT